MNRLGRFLDNIFIERLWRLRQSTCTNFPTPWRPDASSGRESTSGTRCVRTRRWEGARPAKFIATARKCHEQRASRGGSWTPTGARTLAGVASIRVPVHPASRSRASRSALVPSGARRYIWRVRGRWWKRPVRDAHGTRTDGSVPASGQIVSRAVETIGLQLRIAFALSNEVAPSQATTDNGDST